MRLKLAHIPYIADKIALDLITAHYVEILTNRGDIIKIASKYLSQDIERELALEARVREFIEGIDDIESSGANEKQLFFMLKKKFAQEDDFHIVWEERYNDLSHKIMDELIDTSVINFKVSEMMIKNLIFKSINTYAKAYKDIEFSVVERIKNYKKKLLVGTDEYELVFSKMFEEELRKQGFI